MICLALMIAELEL